MAYNSITNNNIYVLTIVAALGLMISCANSESDISVPPFPSGGTTVTVNNKLGGGETVNIHCKSKDDDLGLHSMGPNGKYDFHFEPNFFPHNTLFYCHVTWPGNSHFFNAYDEVIDLDRCHPNCCWNITPQKACDCAAPGFCRVWT